MITKWIKCQKKGARYIQYTYEPVKSQDDNSYACNINVTRWDNGSKHIYSYVKDGLINFNSLREAKAYLEQYNLSNNYETIEIIYK